VLVLQGLLGVQHVLRPVSCDRLLHHLLLLLRPLLLHLCARVHKRVRTCVRVHACVVVACVRAGYLLLLLLLRLGPAKPYRHSVRRKIYLHKGLGFRVQPNPSCTISCCQVREGEGGRGREGERYG
jgi:hypothetical protein